MKRNTLTKNLKIMLERIRELLLPIEIYRVFIHGSYIRGDEFPGDLDVIILYKGKDQWRKWYTDFSSLREVHDLIWDCYNKGMTIDDLIYGPLATELEIRDIPKEWVATYSWSELFGNTTFYIPYMLSWERITRKLLTKGTKGIHIQFESSLDGFKQILDRTFMFHEMPLFLIWDKDIPQEYFIEPDQINLEKYLELENLKLTKDLFQAQCFEKIGTFLINESLKFVPKNEWGEIALRVLSNTPKYEIDELNLRKLLREFNLDEEKVFTFKIRGSKTTYQLAKSVQEENELKIEAEHNEFINDLESKIIKVCRKIIPKAEGNKIFCWIVNTDKYLITLVIENTNIPNYNDFIKIWENRGFKIKDRYGKITAEKKFLLKLNDDIDKQIKQIVGV